MQLLRFFTSTLLMVAFVGLTPAAAQSGPTNCGLHVLNDFINLCEGVSSSVCVDLNGMSRGTMMGTIWGLTGDFPDNFSCVDDLRSYTNEMPNNCYAPIELPVTEGNRHWVAFFKDCAGKLWFRDPQVGKIIPVDGGDFTAVSAQGYVLDDQVFGLPKAVPVGPLKNPSENIVFGLKPYPLNPDYRRPPLPSSTSEGCGSPPPSACGAAAGDAPHVPDGNGLSRRGGKTRTGGKVSKGVKGAGTAFVVFCFYSNASRFAQAYEANSMSGMSEAAWDQFGPPVSPWEVSRAHEEAQLLHGQGDAAAVTPFVMYGRSMGGLACAIATGVECAFGWTAPKGSKALSGVWSPWRGSEE